jgi:transcriptional regulator with XRE-family HTH domain
MLFQGHDMPRKPKSDDGAKLGLRIGKNIKAARTKMGITQSQLAEWLDIETATMSRIETGAQLPGLDRLEAMARRLNVPLSAMVADSKSSSQFVELLSGAVAGLPTADRDFICQFVLDYADHVKGRKRK